MDSSYGNQTNISGDADFYDQFGQNVSAPNASNGGAVILNSDQSKKKKLVFIIVGAAIVACLVVALLIFMNSRGNGASPAGSYDEQLAKDYAGYFIFGEDQLSESAVPEVKKYYFSRYGKEDQDYLASLKDKLSKLIASATGNKKTLAEEQLDLLEFYRIAGIFLNDYASDYDFSEIKESSSVADMFEKIDIYVSTSEDESRAAVSYGEGAISEDEYAEYAIRTAAAETALRRKRQSVQQDLAEYAKGLYETK